MESSKPKRSRNTAGGPSKKQTDKRDAGAQPASPDTGAESLRQEAERGWAASDRRDARKKRQNAARQRTRSETDALRKELDRANQDVTRLKRQQAKDLK